MAKPKYRRKGTQFINYSLVVVFFAAAVTLLLQQVTSWHLYGCWLIGISIATYAAFRVDKARASSNPNARIPNSVLLGATIIGGFVGSWLGMYTRPRHKNRQFFYQAVLIASALAHGALFYYLFVNGLQ